MGAILGKIGYHAGSAGTVTLAPGEKVLHIRALGASNATLAIFGGDSIPIPAAYVFEDFIHSNSPEWVGDSGSKTLVFTSTLSYFVKTLLKL